MMQAYIHKTNWTMQQAKDELDAARKQEDQQSAGTGDADGAPASSSAGSILEQCPALSGSADCRIDDSSESASREALRGSYAGKDIPLLASDSVSDSGQPALLDTGLTLERMNSRAEASGENQTGNAKQQHDAAATLGGEAGGCPYIGFTMSSNFLDAQCLWDATMAFSIAQGLGSASNPRGPDLSAASQSSAGSLQSNRGDEIRAAAAADQAPSAASKQSPMVLHVCGKFHSEGWMGIYEHIHSYHAANIRRQGSTAERLDVVIVTFLPSSRDLSLTSEEFREERLAAYGDFVILTDFNRPRSFEVGHPV